MTVKRHIPERSCIACGKAKPKRELVRIVSCEGSVSVDTGARMNGRGAYLCPVPECWESGLKGGKLERALRSSLSQENKEQLVQYGRNLRS